MVDFSPLDFLFCFYDAVLFFGGLFFLCGVTESFMDDGVVFLNPLHVLDCMFWSGGGVIQTNENCLFSPEDLNRWKYGPCTYSPYLSGWGSGYYERGVLTYCYGTHMDLRCVCSEEILWTQKRQRKTLLFMVWSSLVAYFLSYYGYWEIFVYISTEQFYDPYFSKRGHTPVYKYLFWYLYGRESLVWLFSDMFANKHHLRTGLDFPRDYDPFGDMIPTWETFVWFMKESTKYSWRLFTQSIPSGNGVLDYALHASGFAQTYVEHAVYNGHEGYSIVDEPLGFYRELGDLDPDSFSGYGFYELFPWFREGFATIPYWYWGEFYGYDGGWNEMGTDTHGNFMEWHLQSPYVFHTYTVDYPVDYPILRDSHLFDKVADSFIVYNNP